MRQIHFDDDESFIIGDDYIDRQAVVILENCPLLESIGTYGRREMRALVRKKRFQRRQRAQKVATQQA